MAISAARNKLVQATHPWRLVYRPAAATVATCARLEWEVHDAAAMITDEGRKLDLAEDPPAVVKKEVDEAVKLIMSLGVVVPTWSKGRTAELPLKMPEIDAK